VDALLDRLRSAGFETLRLSARADDDRVRSFYETFGFEPVDDVPGHYDDGGDAVVLARSLQKSSIVRTRTFVGCLTNSPSLAPTT